MRARMSLLFTGLMATTAGSLSGQTMSVSTPTLHLPSPDTLAYDAGLSPALAFTVMVTACTGPMGCRVTIENPHAASLVPIDLHWRLVSVGQTGEGNGGCLAVSALNTWALLPAAPVPVMETGSVVDGTACVAAFEVRASGLAYHLHQFTTPPTTYWRDLLLRTVEK